MSDWTSVADKLPDPDQIVLAWFTREGGEVIKARYYSYGGHKTGHFDSWEFEEYPEVLLPTAHISHWMPMPAGPK